MSGVARVVKDGQGGSRWSMVVKDTRGNWRVIKAASKPEIVNGEQVLPKVSHA